MLPSTALYKAYIQTPHKRIARIDAIDINGTVLAQDVPIVGGSVSANLTNRVARSASFTLTDEWWPRLPTDPFSPFLSVVKVRAGVEYGDGTTEMFPLFTGRVTTASRETDGRVSFDAEDLAADVIAFRFERPQVTRDHGTFGAPPTILGEIEELITEALPSAVFGTHGVADAYLPVLTWDEDRAQALDDLANTLGGRWVADGDGVFTVQPIAYGPVAPVASFLDGPSGMLSRARIMMTRDGTANSVTVVSERQDGTEPVRVTVRDTAPASPTFFGGKFGRVSKVIKVQTPLTTAEAQVFARSELAASVALTEQWDAEIVGDHTLVPGDTVTLSHRGYQSDQVIDAMTYPLSPQETMSLSTRGTVVVQDA